MGGRLRKWAWGAGVPLLLFTCVLTPGAADASVGEITRAQVTAGWTSASIAGVATRISGCQAPPGQPKSGPGEEPPPPPIQPDSPPWTCGWIPYATLGPGSSPGDCSSPSRQWGASEGGVQLVWVGPELKSPGSVPFDLGNVSLTLGSSAPLLCLSAVEAVAEGVVCAAEVGHSCPPHAVVHRTYQLDSAVLQIVSPSRRPCHRSGHGKRRAKKGRIGLGPQMVAKGQRVRRCERD